jgi:Ca2+-binding EF-hand superfamily protein
VSYTAATGSSLTYTEFEILCRDVVGKNDEEDALKSEQISFLIDVIDINGDGTVGRSEFLERYAREDATIQMSLRSSWYYIMQLFHAENKKGIKTKEKTYHLTPDQFQRALTKGLDQNLLGSGGKMTPEQITDMVSNLDPKLKVKKTGEIQYDEWLRKYVPDQYEIHFAMTGDDTTTSMPKWDALIASFETLDKCTMANKSLEADHILSWDHFRKALRMADIGLSNEKVQKIIDKLDKEMTGSVCWTDMVSGPTAPYFFDGKQDYEMRMLLCHGWPALYDKCKQHEILVRKKDTSLLPQIPQSAAGNNKIMTLGTLTPQQFQECLKDCPVLNLRDQNGKELPLVKKIVDVCSKAFLKMDQDRKKMLDRNDKNVIDYDAVCRHYAGASFDAEREFERKWEVVIEVLQELKEQHSGGQLARDTFRNRLSSSDLHVSDATIDFLLRDQPVSMVDIDVICWKTAKGTILKILKKKWSLLLSLCRAKDTKNRRRLDLPTVQAILNRADVGMSSSLVEILLQNLTIEDDGKIDYDKLLSGKLKTGSYPIDVYTAYKSMESEWETLSQHFWEYDLNGDGRVNHEEFRQALRSLQHPALSDMSVITDLIQQLDPDGDPNANPPTDNIDFDKFSWEMARSELIQVVETRGREMLDAFRKEATREFQKHKGKLPAPKAIEALNKALMDTGVKPVLIKILVSRAESSASQKSSAYAGGEPVKMIEETQILKAFREVAGDSFEKAEQAFVRDNFAHMLAESKLAVMDTWRLYGEQHSALKKFAGAASLGADALRHVGPAPLKRVHMHGFLGHGGRFMLESMAASPALVDIKEDRVKTIYSGNPWISFWKVRANYRSPAVTMSQTSAAPNSRGHSQPDARSIPRPAPTASIASSSVSTHPKESDSKAGPENVWEKVRQKVRQAAFQKFQTNQEALNALDPENPGAGAIASAALRQTLEALVPDLNSAELELITEKLDPGRDGMVLKSDIAYMLLPPAADRSSLERLAQERHARGIYARLRGRQATLSSPPGTSLPPHTSRARPGESGPSLLQQRLGAQVTGGVSVSGQDAGYRYAYNWNRVEHPPGAVRPSYDPSQRGGVQSGQGTRPGAYVGDSSDPWTGRNPWPSPESANVFPSSFGYPPFNAASGQYHRDARRGAYSERPIEQVQYRSLATTGLMATEPRYSMTPAQDSGTVRDVDELQDLYRSTMEQVCLQMPAICCCFHLFRICTLTCVLGASSFHSYKIATN